MRTNGIKIQSTINQSYCIIRTFDLRRTLPKYLRTLLHKNSVLTIGITDQSGTVYAYFMFRIFIHTVHKNKNKLRNIFICKKPGTFQKARQFPLRFNIQKAIHLTLQDFHEIFEVGIYIQKALHFALRAVFIYKKLDTSQKSRQFAIRFYMQKSVTFSLRDFSLNF